MKTNRNFLKVLMILSMLFAIYERVEVAMAKEPVAEKTMIEEIDLSKMQEQRILESLLQAGVEVVLWSDIN